MSRHPRNAGMAKPRRFMLAVRRDRMVFWYKHYGIQLEWEAKPFRRIGLVFFQ